MILSLSYSTIWTALNNVIRYDAQFDWLRALTNQSIRFESMNLESIMIENNS